MKRIGVNINTSPVLDLRIKGASSIIGDRSFSKNPKIVSKIGDYCIKYFKENGIGTVIKHIPGHGLSKVDSHQQLPLVNQNINYLNTEKIRFDYDISQFFCLHFLSGLQFLYFRLLFK